MVRQIKKLNMNFIFHQPTECNLYLVHDFNANWDPSDPDHELKIHGKKVHFIAMDINDLLGMPKADTNQLRAYGPILTMAERQSRADVISTRMFGLQMLQLWIGERSITNKELCAVGLDYPLGHHARTLLQIGPELVESVNDNVPIDAERQYPDSDI
ncbi:hypothetical protein T459_23636 [Capsicum annuum]|uniref:Uncharacterized protein n=1 Tax=Capsicum annuum TaxID=4072 RepID=A0A2G2YT90_CAPAN|nr:hypothetical protein T459_23636 [Capsicum annuum]